MEVKIQFNFFEMEVRIEFILHLTRSIVIVIKDDKICHAITKLYQIIKITHLHLQEQKKKT